MNIRCFTNEEKQKAHKADIVSLLRRNGEQVKHRGSEYEWREGADKITIKDNLWYNHYEQTGGDTVDFVRRFYNKYYPEAIAFILDSIIMVQDIGEFKFTEQKNFILPKRNNNMNRVYAYLINTRGLDREVVHTFAHNGMLYESAVYHDAVFVGFDKDGVPRHAHKRGTAPDSTFKISQAGSKLDYSFHWIGSSNRLYLFEAPIDMLSFITMYSYDWQKNSYASACSVSPKVLYQCLKDYPHITEIYIGFDNDEVGRLSAQLVSQNVSKKGYRVAILKPELKDWNEDLLNKRKEVLCV